MRIQKGLSRTCPDSVLATAQIRPCIIFDETHPFECAYRMLRPGSLRVWKTQVIFDQSEGRNYPSNRKGTQIELASWLKVMAQSDRYKMLHTRYEALTARATAGGSLVSDTAYADFLK